MRAWRVRGEDDAVQDMIWTGVSVGFMALSLLYVALADKA